MPAASSVIYSYDTNGQSSLTPSTSSVAAVCPTQSSYMSTATPYDEISLKTTNMYYQSNHASTDQTHVHTNNVNNTNSYYPSWSSNSLAAYDSATTPNYSSRNSWNYPTSGCYPDLTSSASSTSAINTNLANSQHLTSDHLNHVNLPATCWSSGYGGQAAIGTNQVYYQ